MLISEDFRADVTPGFFLLIAIAWYLDRGAEVILWALLACVVHELGHIVAAVLLKGRIRRLKLSAVGMELHFQHRGVLSYGAENMLALSGPIANLLMGAVAYALEMWIPAVISAVVGGFNLIPILPLDGGRVMHNVLTSFLSPPWPEHVIMVVTGILAGVLFGLGMIGMAAYGNVSLLLTSGWLLLRTIRNYAKKRK